MRPCKTRSRPRYSTIKIPPYAEHTQAQVLKPLKDNDEHERNLKQYRITANHKKLGLDGKGKGKGKGKNLTPYSCSGVGIKTIHAICHMFYRRQTLKSSKSWISVRMRGSTCLVIICPINIIIIFWVLSKLYRFCLWPLFNISRHEFQYLASPGYDHPSFTQPCAPQWWNPHHNAGKVTTNRAEFFFGNVIYCDVIIVTHTLRLCCSYGYSKATSENDRTCSTELPVFLKKISTLRWCIPQKDE